MTKAIANYACKTSLRDHCDLCMTYGNYKSNYQELTMNQASKMKEWGFIESTISCEYDLNIDITSMEQLYDILIYLGKHIMNPITFPKGCDCKWNIPQMDLNGSFNGPLLSENAMDLNHQTLGGSREACLQIKPIFHGIS